ncbi:aminopeptidase [Halosquirtibacter laminarini]|uniref:Aminopeptidase n=1 Tax=Halosquirtibacter laminarini TaxID=3374600 RepID=A0AC61NPU7_9BACT|nr:aminopeptidase [Prolixibacteraceae bacterium]
MKNILAIALLALSLLSVDGAMAGQRKKKDKVKGYVFTPVKELQATSVKDQNRSGTCWAFSGESFLESEMIRMGKDPVNLSEMFVVYHTYADKARKYVRMHGYLNFGPGGAFHDVSYVLGKYGAVPESVYSGMNYGTEKPVQGEMDTMLKAQVDAVIKNKNRKLSTAWDKAITSTLDAYLGHAPEKFVYEGKEYTSQSFAKDYCGLNADDYVEITSYTHHPFYSKFILEVPDNWMWNNVYNVPLKEMDRIMDNAISNGFTVGWAADVSEKGFATKSKGVAVVPDVNFKEMNDAEISKWESLSSSEQKQKLYSMDKPGPEKEITQENRQLAYDNYETTDDHGMHIVGTAKDQTGKLYYKVKNSWGAYNKYKGYFYCSKAFFNYKTMCIMVHKDAIPADIRKKLGL